MFVSEVVPEGTTSVRSAAAGRAKPARIVGIDAARGGAVLLVVLLHASVPVRTELPLLLTWLNYAAGGARMPLMMMLSGLLAQSLGRSDRRSLRRAADMAWIYAVWSIIGWLTNDWDIARLALLPESGLWYIWSLAFVAALMPLTRRMPASFVVCVASLISMASYSHVLAGEATTTDHLLRQTVFFYIGFYAGPSVIRYCQKLPLTVAAACLVVAALAHFGNTLTAAWFGVPALAIVERFSVALLALILCLYLPLSVARCFAWIGQRSLPIYVGHLVLVLPLGTLIEFSNSLNRVTFVAVVSVIISLFVHAVLVKGRLSFIYRRPELSLGVRLHSASSARLS